jgi:hypothetical protein
VEISIATAAVAALLGLAGPAQAGEFAVDLTVGQAHSQTSGSETNTLGLGVMLGYNEPGWWVSPEAGYNSRSDLFYQDNHEIDLGIGHAWTLGATTVHLGGGYTQLSFSNNSESASSSGSYLRAGLSWRVAQLGGFRMGVEARRVNSSQLTQPSFLQTGSYSELALLLGWRI